MARRYKIRFIEDDKERRAEVFLFRDKPEISARRDVIHFAMSTCRNVTSIKLIEEDDDWRDDEASIWLEK